MSKGISEGGSTWNAPLADLRTTLGSQFSRYLLWSRSFGWSHHKLGKHFLTLFAVIPLLRLISSQALFDVICCDPAPLADLRTSLGSTFSRYLLWSRSFGWSHHKLGKHFLTLFAVIPLLWLISGQAWEDTFQAICCDPAPSADLITN